MKTLGKKIMRSVIVNGGQSVEIPFELRATVASVICNPVLPSVEKHERVCLALRIGRFTPAPNHGPYALRSTVIEIYDESHCVMRYGGWLECAHCHNVLSADRRTLTAHRDSGRFLKCPGCGGGQISNFKWAPQKKQVKQSDMLVLHNDE